jgi:hypothetical protein
MEKEICISLNPTRASKMIAGRLHSTITTYAPDGIKTPTKVFFGVEASFPKVMIRGENDYKTNGRIYGDGILTKIASYSVEELLAAEKDGKLWRIKKMAWIDDAYIKTLPAGKTRIYVWFFAEIKIYGRPRLPDMLLYYKDRPDCLKEKCHLWDANVGCLFQDFSSKKKKNCVYDKEAKLKALPKVWCFVGE